MTHDTSTARRWLGARGFGDADGQTWYNALGENLGDLLRADYGAPSGLWVGDEIDTATYTPAHIMDDGSAIIITGGWWDVVDGGERAPGGMALTDARIDEEANERAPDGCVIVRGSYYGTTDDRADRLYITEGDDSGPLDRRGPGYACIEEAMVMPTQGAR